MPDLNQTFVSKLLQPDDDTSAFDCGEPALNHWLHNEANRAQQQGTARTTVWLDADNHAVAFYSICPTSVRGDSVPRTARGGNSVVPAYLLARLALDRHLQGRHLGAQLLVDALEKLADATTRFGGRLVVVDAISDRAAGFYETYGFHRISGTTRLYLNASSLRAVNERG